MNILIHLLTIQTYQLIDNITPLDCPVGGFCDNETNRTNLKNYMNDPTLADPRCGSTGQSTDQSTGQSTE
jgi:hypothetical protein